MLLAGLIAALALVALNVWLYLTFRRNTKRRNPIDVAPPYDEPCPTCQALDAAPDASDHPEKPGDGRQYGNDGTESGSFSDKLR